MILNTASATIGFARKLEEDSAKFYENLSRRYTKYGDVFLAFIAENKKNVAQIERAYYEVISDAIEGCFAFNVDSDEYVLKTNLPDEAGYFEALKIAAEMEDKIIKFYSDAAEQSKSLMADIPRAFTIVAKKRSSRKTKLRALDREPDRQNG